MRASYERSVGRHIWFFYIDPETAQLLGCKLHLTNERRNDGSTMVFKGEVEAGGPRLPAARTWYTHRGHRLQGVDTVVSVEILDGL